MKTAIKTLVFVAFGVFLCGVAFTVGSTPRMVFVGDAEAVVGMPRTPLSVAGVARRTTRRVVGTTAVVATTTAAATAAAAQPAVPHPPPPSAPPTATAVPIGTAVQALPGGCVPVVIGGASYSDCGGVFYKAAFQGNNLVYVVVPKPIP